LPEDRARCLAVGMDDYLAKPLDRQQLNEVLVRWLHGATQVLRPTADKPLPPVSFEASPVEHEALSKLRRLGGANQSFLSELIDVFLQESVERLALMKETAANKDMTVVHRIAHTHRGACINFGAQKMAQLCVQLENTGRSNNDGELDAVNEMIVRIEREFFRVNRMLEEERFAQAEDV
jgi:HPt (histidine-containing phosphotransfer) domain-containing protein